MKRINVFETKDGEKFSVEEEALRYEYILDELIDFLSAYIEIDDINFANGGGYIQHPVGTRDKMNKKLVELSNRWFNSKEPFTVFNYYLGRVIDDGNMKCLNHLSYRVRCIDNDEKEWGQPYYALNKGKGEDKKLN